MSEGGDRVTDFEKLYNTYFNDVYLYIRRLSGDAHIAEEITSETFFKAMHSIDSFRGDCDVRVWLCQIAKNCYYTHIKKAGKIQATDLDALQNLPDTAPGLAEQLIRKEEVGRIQMVLHDVSEPYKEVFMWRVFAQLSFKQIGSIFGKNENWACVAYHRARKMIIVRLEEMDK